MSDATKTVKEGHFGMEVEHQNGTKETFERTNRTLEVTSSGGVVITRHDNGRVTVLPPGTKVVTE